MDIKRSIELWKGSIAKYKGIVILATIGYLLFRYWDANKACGVSKTLRIDIIPYWLNEGKSVIIVTVIALLLIFLTKAKSKNQYFWPLYITLALIYVAGYAVMFLPLVLFCK